MAPTRENTGLMLSSLCFLVQMSRLGTNQDAFSWEKRGENAKVQLRKKERKRREEKRREEKTKEAQKRKERESWVGVLAPFQGFGVCRNKSKQRSAQLMKAIIMFSSFLRRTFNFFFHFSNFFGKTRKVRLRYTKMRESVNVSATQNHVKSSHYVKKRKVMEICSIFWMFVPP